MIISKTPLRVSFFGGGTDIPEYFRGGRGAVVGSAIDKYIYISINRFFSKLFDYRLRLAYRLTECVDHVYELQHKPAAAILASVGLTQDVEIGINADLPAFSGLGSSSSFTVGLINAASTFNGCSLKPEELASLAIQMERDTLHEAVGYQDQTFAAYGGLRIIEFFPERDPVVTALRLNALALKELSQSVVLFFTGIKRKAQDIESKKIKNIDRLTMTLDKMLRDVDTAVEIIEKSGDVEAFGRLLRRSWHLKRSLDDGVSNAQIDSMYQRGLAAGAYGGKLLGAGGGGFMLFICPLEFQENLRFELSEFTEIPVQLCAAGSSIIYNE